MIKSSTTFFRHFNKHSNDPICCPQCDEEMTVRHFYYTHASNEHSLNFRKQCVFCFGRRQWNHVEKNLSVNVNHVVSCLKLFVTNAKDIWALLNDKVIAEETQEVEVVETCECQHFQPNPRDMYGRPKLYAARLYESVFQKPDMWEEGIEFDEASGLGKDVYGIIQRYLRKDLNWFHIIVKHDIFDTFCREMENIRDQFVILPFWCLCDGLTFKTQHRHMIVACRRDGSFEHVWKTKVRYEFPKSGHAKTCIEIKNAFHLARAKSSCDDIKLNNPEEQSHFHINRHLHPHSIAFLCTLFPGGIEKLLSEQLGNKNVSSWENVAKRVRDPWHNVRWGVPIGVMGWKFLNCVIPLYPR